MPEPGTTATPGTIASTGAPTRRLFVYGTLRPGDVRWPLLEPHVDGPGRPDAALGRLYDTGLGYPAAVFDAADGHGASDSGAEGGARDGAADGPRPAVHGTTFTLQAATAAEALALLDVEEDIAIGLYRRVRLRTLAGFDAWAYASGVGLQLRPIASGDWYTRGPTP